MMLLDKRQKVRGRNDANVTRLSCDDRSSTRLLIQYSQLTQKSPSAPHRKQSTLTPLTSQRHQRRASIKHDHVRCRIPLPQQQTPGRPHTLRSQTLQRRPQRSANQFEMRLIHMPPITPAHEHTSCIVSTQYVGDQHTQSSHNQSRNDQINP